MTPQEAGELCLLSGLCGQNRDIFFPKPSEELQLTTFSEIAIRYLNAHGYEAVQCSSENEARNLATELISKKQWPCYFFESDTTGEKDFEEFFTQKENLDMDRFNSIGIIMNQATFNLSNLEEFTKGVQDLRAKGSWSKDEIVNLYFNVLPDFAHKETGTYLDQRM